jgi:hypothetical protein
MNPPPCRADAALAGSRIAKRIARAETDELGEVGADSVGGNRGEELLNFLVTGESLSAYLPAISKGGHNQAKHNCKESVHLSSCPLKTASYFASDRATTPDH